MELPVKQNTEFDVVVAGGGPAGCAAAYSAAKNGAKVLLIEQTGALGGMGTSGLVPGWCPFTDGEHFLYGSFAQKVFEASIVDMVHLTQEQKQGVWTPIYPERLKIVYDDLMKEAGVCVLLGTAIAAVNQEAGTVEGVVAANKDGLTQFTAACFVDCTGDADVAAWAGAPYHKGEEGSGELQASTLCFILSNVNSFAMRFGPKFHPGMDENSPIYQIMHSPKYKDRVPDSHFCIKPECDGAIGCNAGHIFNLDATDPWAVSRAMAEGRKLADTLCEGLQEFHPKAFVNARVTATGNLMGIRESRRIDGEYTLTKEDYFARRSFPDEIGRNCYQVDIHNTLEVAQTLTSRQAHLDYEKKNNQGEKYKRGESHGIPYGCLLPKGIKNLLVAGRSISCDRVVQASIRVMPTCLMTGQAAGTAAALAVQSGAQDVRQVDTARLRQVLRASGSYLPGAE